MVAQLEAECNRVSYNWNRSDHQSLGYSGFLSFIAAFRRFLVHRFLWSIRC